MRIRSITAFIPVPDPFAIRNGAKTAISLRDRLQAEGYEVQTLRLATRSFTAWVRDPADTVAEITKWEREAKQSGFDYLSVGPVPCGNGTGLSQVADILKNTQDTFCTCHLLEPEKPIDLVWLQQVGEVILQNSKSDKQGFTNLRFAGLANVQAGCPFFPAAYADHTRPAFAIAMEAADLAVEVFKAAESAEKAAGALKSAIEDAGQTIDRCCQPVAGKQYQGIDFTLAPFPEEARSIGSALEALGIPGFGKSGSLAASAYLMSILDQAKFTRTGFNGLMLPILEDACLAERNSSGEISIQQLLLYSTVCGTGLDCIPLPGDISAAQLLSILLDVSALSRRLQKPLTARLMPVPGKQAGEMTQFDFGYFANSRIMDPVSAELNGLFTRGMKIPISPRTGI